jgi:DNA repair protein SbcD/Mre11
MRFLHTSDWHVGKVLKGHSRLDEQKAVLDEIVGIAADRSVDAVLIAGDLYESAAPPAEAQQLVVQTMLRLRRTGAEVIAIAGNHDHAPTFEAYRPLMAAAGITMVGQVRPADRGGVVEFRAASSGEPVRVALLPFLSQRYAVTAAQLIARTPAENSAGYDERMRALIRALTGGFTPDAVNIVMAHLTVINGTLGGGERAAQSIFEYHVPAAAFPAQAHYVALGHLHRRQAMPAPCPVHYCGSPLAVDFGEADNAPVVLVVEAGLGTPAAVTEVPITSARTLRIVAGTLDELTAMAPLLGEAYLRVVVREPARAGLREQVQELLPNALEVRIDAGLPDAPAAGPSGPDRTPGELFAEFCGQRGVADPAVDALFARLHDQVVS